MTEKGKNTVDVLFEGYSMDEENLMRANCSCTLVCGRSGVNMIVDTMTAWDGDKLQEALRKHKLTTDDIHFVVCTHGHSDHIGCNYLFPKAQHIVGRSCSHKDEYYPHLDDNATYALDPTGEIAVVPTAGHTLSCVSLIVKNTADGATYGICGDLFEKSEDIGDEGIWLAAGSENPPLQRLHRLQMAAQCEIIVPGHGPAFAVTPEMLIKLKTADNNCEKREELSSV